MAPDLKSVLEKAQYLVFDFDGTLVDSNEIKWRAFEEVFRDFPDRLEEISRYCRGSNHTIRGEKFRHVYENILNLSYTDSVDRTLHEQYARFTTQSVIHAPEIPGAESFLRRIAGRYETAVLSSTPHEILPIILEGRHWKDLFQVLQGAPVNKAGWLHYFRQKRSFGLHELIFFGDTREDADAAKAAECTFIAVNSGQHCSDLNPYAIQDFHGLL